MSEALRADWLEAPQTRKVIAALDAARPGASRFVGGCVRNALLGQEADDIDIATQLTPPAVMAAARAAGLAAIPTGVEHGTVTVIADHKPFEVTTLRRDVSTDGRRATVAFTEDWAEDAARRDFRLNALYAEPDGALHDPTGGGLKDARAGRIIFIGDAAQRIREDYLRILRFFRFSAWYAKAGLDPRGLAASAELKHGLAQISAERVWKEIKKMAGAHDPRAAFAAMSETGVLAAALPEAGDLAVFDALIELETSYLFAPDPMTRLAALIEREANAQALAQRLKLSNDERARLRAALSADGERLVSYLSPKDVRRQLYRIGLEAFTDRVLLAWARDEGGARAAQWRALLAMAETYERPRLPLSGDDILAAGVPAGPKVGETMREVEAWWIDCDFPDDRLAVIERLKAVAQGLS